MTYEVAAAGGSPGQAGVVRVEGVEGSTAAHHTSLWAFLEQETAAKRCFVSVEVRSSSYSAQRSVWGSTNNLAGALRIPADKQVLTSDAGI